MYKNYSITENLLRAEIYGALFEEIVHTGTVNKDENGKVFVELTSQNITKMGRALGHPEIKANKLIARGIRSLMHGCKFAFKSSCSGAIKSLYINPEYYNYQMTTSHAAKKQGYVFRTYADNDISKLNYKKWEYNN